MAGKELATQADLEDRFPVLFDTEEGNEIAELLEENLGDDTLRASDFPRYKVPSGDGVAWSDTSAGEDDVPKRKIRGLVLLRNTPRAFFRMSIEERAAAKIEDKTPDCSSPDGKVGIGEYGATKYDEETREQVPNKNAANPTGACASCPMNKYGTAKQGQGKGCKQREAWWILEEGAMLPKQVQVPAGSLQSSKEYRVGLLGRGRKVSSVVTEFGLRPAKNKAGTAYKEVTFTDVDVLDKESAAKAAAYGAQMKEMLAATAYADATSETDPEAPAEGSASAAWNPAEADPNDPFATED